MFPRKLFRIQSQFSDLLCMDFNWVLSENCKVFCIDNLCNKKAKTIIALRLIMKKNSTDSAGIYKIK